MIMKRQRESLRGLSHEDKVKKIQKLTCVPMRNLKTNIIESDLEQDDIQIPISLKQVAIDQRMQPSPLQKDRLVVNRQKKPQRGEQYDQQKINKSIRAMTNQLYSLQRQRQSLSQKEYKQIAQPNISNFTIEEIDLELQKLTGKENVNNKGQKKESGMGKGRHRRNQSSREELEGGNIGLDDIKDRINQQANRMSVDVNQKQPLMRRAQFLPQRQTQPIYSAETSAHLQKHSQNQVSQNKRQSSQSTVTKRFSRSKKDPDSLNGDNMMDKKPKFNRSSNLNNKQITNLNINNKQNHENFNDPKKHLLTQRLSYQQMSAYEKPQTELKKKKNAGKPFEHNYEGSHHENFQNDLKKEQIALKPNLNSQSVRQRIRQQIVQFQRLSQKEVFNKFSQYNIRGYTFNQKEKELLAQMFKSYKQTIDLLRISL